MIYIWVENIYPTVITVLMPVYRQGLDLISKTGHWGWMPILVSAKLLREHLHITFLCILRWGINSESCNFIKPETPEKAIILFQEFQVYILCIVKTQKKPVGFCYPQTLNFLPNQLCCDYFTESQQTESQATESQQTESQAGVASSTTVAASVDSAFAFLLPPHDAKDTATNATNKNTNFFIFFAFKIL